MLEKSLRQHGAGRSILVDKHGVAIAGNKTLQSAVSVGMNEVIVVESDGKKLVVVQRTDLDLATDATARALAYADNRASEVGLDWDVAQLLEDVGTGAQLEGLFREDEIEALADAADESTAHLVGEPRDPGRRTVVIRPVMEVLDVAVVEQALALTGVQHRGAALLAICRPYLGGSSLQGIDA